MVNRVLLLSLVLSPYILLGQINMLYPQQKFNWSDYQLKGKVHEMLEKMEQNPELSQKQMDHYGSFVRQHRLIQIQFDSTGNLTNALFISPDSTVFSQFYDFDNDVLRCTNWVHYYEYCYTYSEDGRIYEMRTKPLRTRSYNTQILTMVYSYDLTGRLNETHEHDEDKRLTRYEKWTYDQSGNLIERSSEDYIYHQDSKICSDTIKYVYKVKYHDGEIIEITMESNSEYTSKSISTYKYLHGELIYERCQEYNQELLTLDVEFTIENGLVVTTKSLHLETGLRILRTYTYEFDEQGNWVKKVTHIDNIPILISTRTISYY